MQPKRVARRVGNAIRAVRAPGKAAIEQILLQIALFCIQKRAIEPAVVARHAARALQPAAAQQMHQHRLRLIVQVVRQRNSIRVSFRENPVQRRVAHGARDGFEALSGSLRLGGNVQRDDLNRHVQRIADRFAEFRIRPAVLSANAVFDMNGQQAKIQRLPLPGEHVQKRYGIRAAGQRDDQRPAARVGK